MASIRETEARFAPSAEATVAASGSGSLLDKVLDWFGYSGTYAEGAECLSRQGHEMYLPWQQLAGRAFECALRACLASVSFNAPPPHDLLSLFEQAETLGFELREADLVMLVLVSHAYRETELYTSYAPVYPAQFGVVSQYSRPPSLRLNRALRDLRRQALLRLGTSEAEA